MSICHEQNEFLGLLFGLFLMRPKLDMAALWPPLPASSLATQMLDRSKTAREASIHSRLSFIGRAASLLAEANQASLKRHYRNRMTGALFSWIVTTLLALVLISYASSLTWSTAVVMLLVGCVFFIGRHLVRSYEAWFHSSVRMQQLDAYRRLPWVWAD